MLSGYSGTYTLGAERALTVGTSAMRGYSENIGVEGTGTFTQTGGTHTVYGALDLGDNSGSQGAYTLSGGTLGLTVPRTSASREPGRSPSPAARIPWWAI